MYISSTTATATGIARTGDGEGARRPRRGVDRDRGELSALISEGLLGLLLLA